MSQHVGHRLCRHQSGACKTLMHISQLRLPNPRSLALQGCDACPLRRSQGDWSCGWWLHKVGLLSKATNTSYYLEREETAITPRLCTLITKTPQPLRLRSWLQSLLHGGCYCPGDELVLFKQN